MNDAIKYALWRDSRNSLILKIIQLEHTGGTLAVIQEMDSIIEKIQTTEYKYNLHKIVKVEK
jgi:hypothetical protein